MDEVWFWGLAVLAAALVGMGKGGVPIVGMLSVPVMALVMNPVMAAGMLLPADQVTSRDDSSRASCSLPLAKSRLEVF